MPPMRPRSVGIGAISPIRACWFRSVVPVVGQRRDDGGRHGGVHAGTAAPSLSRMRLPVIPCWNGSPPVPIVVSVVAGSTGSEPVVPRKVLATSPPDASRSVHAEKPSENDSLPTPFQTISTTSGGSALGRTAVSIGTPLRISGCGRSYPIRRATRRSDAVEARAGWDLAGVDPVSEPHDGDAVLQRRERCMRPRRVRAPGRASRDLGPARRRHDVRRIDLAGTRPRSASADRRKRHRRGPPPRPGSRRHSSGPRRTP